MRSFLKATWILLLLLSFAVAGLAQQRRPQIPSQFRHISGHVVNGLTNRPVQGAYVRLLTQDGGVQTDATTGSNGRFQFDNIPAAVFYVDARMPGFARSASRRLDLSLQARAYVILTLYPNRDSQDAQPSSAEPMVSLQSLNVPEDAQNEFQKGRQALLEQNDASTGEQHLLHAIELFPQYVEAYELLGASYMAQEKWEDAEGAFNQSKELNPKSAPAYFGLAAIYKHRDSPDQARTALEQGLGLDPSSWSGHMELALNLLARKDLVGAEVHAQRAHELEPNAPLTHITLGNVLLLKGALDPAKQEYQHYLELAPEGPLVATLKQKIAEIDSKKKQQARNASQANAAAPPAAVQEFQKGQQALSRGELEPALQHFRKATTLYPDYLQAHFMAGTVLMNQQKWEEAEQTLTHCLELKDGFAPAYAALGSLYNMQGNLQKALPALQRAVELDPDLWQGHFELAQNLLAQNQLQEAESHARRAHELANDYPLVHVVLGNILLKQHNVTEARQEYTHYLLLAPQGPLAAQLTAKIQQLDQALLGQ